MDYFIEGYALVRNEEWFSSDGIDSGFSTTVAPKVYKTERLARRSKAFHWRGVKVVPIRISVVFPGVDQLEESSVSKSE